MNLPSDVQLDSIHISKLNDVGVGKGLHRVRLTVLVRVTGVPHVRSLRIPMIVESQTTRKTRRVEAVGISDEGVSATWVDLDLEDGLYRTWMVSQEERAARFRLVSGHAWPALVCRHRVEHPSEIQSRIISDARGKPLLAEAMGVMQACCVVGQSPQRSNAYALGLYVPSSGTIKLQVGARQWVVRKGEYLVVNPEEASWPAEGQDWPITLWQIMVYQSALRQFREAIGLPRSLGSFGFDPAPRRLEGGLADALKVWREARETLAQPGGAEMERAALRLWLIQLFRYHPSQVLREFQTLGAVGTGDARLATVARIIAQLPVKELSLAKVAEEAGVGETWLRRHFRDTFHQSPREFANWARIQRAVDLLRTTSSSVQEISRALGYQDVSALYKMFRRYAQKNPREIREG